MDMIFVMVPLFKYYSIAFPDILEYLSAAFWYLIVYHLTSVFHYHDQVIVQEIYWMLIMIIFIHQINLSAAFDWILFCDLIILFFDYPEQAFAMHFLVFSSALRYTPFTFASDHFLTENLLIKGTCICIVSRSMFSVFRQFIPPPIEDGGILANLC